MLSTFAMLMMEREKPIFGKRVCRIMVLKLCRFYRKWNNRFSFYSILIVNFTRYRSYSLLVNTIAILQTKESFDFRISRNTILADTSIFGTTSRFNYSYPMTLLAVVKKKNIKIKEENKKTYEFFLRRLTLSRIIESNRKNLVVPTIFRSIEIRFFGWRASARLKLHAGLK